MAKLVRFRLNSLDEVPEHDPAVEKLVLQWKTLSYKVTTGEGEKVILKPQSGVLKGGEVLALMG